MNKYYSHPTAEISDKAKIGEGTKIWNNAQVRENAVIGKNCVISKDVYIDEGVKIGSDVKIQNGVNVYKGVEIEDKVFLGPSMTFTNDMYPRAFNDNWKITPTIVRYGASIGAGAVVRCGVVINKYAMVGAGSVITQDVEEYSLVVGNPARQIGWVCKCGTKLNDEHKCKSCGLQYIFKQGKLSEEN